VSYGRSGDVLIVTKLDRLGRSLSQVLSVLNQLTSKEVTLITLDGAVDTSTKLTDEQKSEVNLLFADGMSKSKLSKKYNVSRSTILTIVSNKDNK